MGTRCECRLVEEPSNKCEKNSVCAAFYGCSISESLSLRIYSDTKPQNLNTSDLQKGIVLVHNGKEVVGEGTGFGVPITKYGDATIFSGSSVLRVRRSKNSLVIQKEFSMDLAIADKFRNLKLENAQIRNLIDFVCVLYQQHKKVAKSVLLAKELLLKLGAASAFVRTTPKGKVLTTYTVRGNRIHVKMNFSQLMQKDLQKIFVLNEQGAHFFRIYSDSEGNKLIDDEIGVWTVVTAKSATISDHKVKTSFNLKGINGALIRRGREMMKGSLDWTGLDYELNPEIQQFDYDIEIQG